MLPDIQNMTMGELVDLLAQETQKFTQLMMEKEKSPEYETTKNLVQQIQAIIAVRKHLSQGEEEPGVNKQVSNL